MRLLVDADVMSVCIIVTFPWKPMVDFGDVRSMAICEIILVIVFPLEGSQYFLRGPFPNFCSNAFCEH